LILLLLAGFQNGRSQKRSQQGRKRCIVVMQNNSGGGGDIAKEVVVKESTSDRREEGSLETTQKVEDPRKSILSILCPLLKFFGVIFPLYNCCLHLT
jgi:hypothetical protein